MDTQLSLQEQLDAVFAMAPGRIVLWHDVEGRYAVIPELELPSDVVLLRDEDGSSFDVMRAINNLEVDERALLYRSAPAAVRDGDWFADLEASATSFYPVGEFEAAEGDAAAASVDAGADMPINAGAVAPAGSLSDVDPVPAPSTPSRFTQDWYTLDQMAALCECDVNDRPTLVRCAWSACYNVYSDCAVRVRYSGLGDYYAALFEAPLVIRDSLDPALAASRSFIQYVYQANYAGKIFDYDADTWITRAGLAELDISQADIDAFVRDALERCEDDGTPYFTEYWLAHSAASLPFFSYGLSRMFYESVLVSQTGALSHGSLAGVKLFARRGQPVQGRDFIAALVQREVSIDLDELVDILAEDYGIKLPRGQVLSLARKANLYYSKDHDRLYKDHDQFILEME